MARPERLGPYVIAEPIGKGGMGHVYAAVHDETGDRVAVKALSPELAMAEGFRDRFEAEIESLKLLRHAGIVQLFGYGEQDGSLFYAMELVDGASLDEELRAGRRFNWREATQVGIQVCRALKHAHDHGIIHRDIKPANILLDRSERVKLADFGIARLFGSTQLTTAGGILGTADYMSPEQADGKPVTDRCDQYSLGCVLYALLAGRPPFRAATLPEMLQLQRYAEPEPVRRYAPHTPQHLEKVINQMLSKTPVDRFPNTMVLAKHLEAMTLALTKPARDGQESASSDVNKPDDAVSSVPIHLAATQVEAPGSEATGESISLVLTSEEPTMLVEGQEEVDDEKDSLAADDEPYNDSEARSFTVVGEESRAEETRPWQVAVQVLIVVVVAAAGGYGLLRLFSLPSADELYAAIMAVDAEDWRDGNPSASDRMEQFDQRFPQDARSDSLQPLRDQLATAELGRRLRAIALRGERPEDHLPPEQQLYLRAVSVAKQNPAEGALQLRRLIELLGAEIAAPAGPSSTPLVTLAKQRLAELQRSMESHARQHLPFLERRLASAKDLQEESPQEVAAICVAIVDLYQHQPWAAEYVAQAKQLIAALEAP